MAEPLRFHPDVVNDLEGAAAWYDEISVELGNRFRAAVDSRLDAVELRPESFGMVDPPLRAARVERFPYLIVFGHTTQNIRKVPSGSPSFFRNGRSRNRIDHNTTSSPSFTAATDVLLVVGRLKDSAYLGFRE